MDEYDKNLTEGFEDKSCDGTDFHENNGEQVLNHQPSQATIQNAYQSAQTQYNAGSDYSNYNQPQETPVYSEYTHSQYTPSEEEACGYDSYGYTNTASNGYDETMYVSEPPKKEPKYVTRKAFVLTLIFCMLLSAVLGAGVFALSEKLLGNSTINKSIHQTNYNLVAATGSELSIQEIIAKNENSVVAIETESVARDTWMGQYVTQGAGSGVIYSEDGYVITNNHVISGAASIKVTLYNGEVYPATLIATDSQTDLAVLKIEAKGLTPVELGDKSTLSVGSLAVAIGNPLGTLSGTATEGIVSALEREISVEGKSMTLIQTSASINPGNSGGGLFDQYGKLIGIVVAKSSGSDVEGLGFAIPVDKVEVIVKDLLEKGYVEGRPAAGISILNLTSANDALKYGVSIPGVYIQEVTGDNAKKAGFKPGDMVYYIEDVKVTSSAQLIKEIQNHKVGDTVEFTVVRGNEMIKIKTVLEDASKYNNTQSETFPNQGEGN